ncbi:MAG: hypothetical protein A2Z12_08355 [Actinobacteria bacterium RBG_16_68_21]|nr:MAG: hypothetical protein A2Z12_08355 [Actinobacteria bacterium RBG_16_68_21]
MPTGRGWAALGVAAALFALWAGFGEVELMATGTFLVAAVAVGVGFVRFASPAVGVTRRIYPPQVHEGDEVTVEVDIVTERRLRNVFVEDTVHGLGTARFAAARTGPGQRVTARYEVLCRTRGVYPVGPAEVAITDPFALVERRSPTGELDRLMVYPRVERLTGFPAVRGIDPAVQSTRPTFAPYGGEDFYTLREYQVGDDLRKVHWPSSAKRDALMIRQLEVPWQARALVLLDARADRYPIPQAFEHAVRGAASAVSHLYQGGFSPELWATERAPGSRSDNRYQQAMEILASIQPTPNLDLRRTVARLRRQGVGGGALIVVTGVPDDGVLGAYRVLAKDFTRTVVMAVADRPGETAGTFQRAGAVTVYAGPSGAWAPAWRTAMELSWSTASVG